MNSRLPCFLCLVILDPAYVPLANLVNFLKPLALAFLVGAVLLILWEAAVLLGALIASLHQ
jgi:hypothetical protein